MVNIVHRCPLRVILDQYVSISILRGRLQMTPPHFPLFDSLFRKTSFMEVPTRYIPFFRLYVILPMNGQGIYTTWTCIASLLNFGIALRYQAELPMETVCNVCLGLLITLIIVYFILENLILDNYIRLLLTPYLGMYLLIIPHKIASSNFMQNCQILKKY